MIASIYYLIKMVWWFFAGLALIMVGIGWVIYMALRSCWLINLWLWKALFQATNRLHTAAYDRGETRRS